MPDLDSLSRDELIRLIRDLYRQNNGQRKTIEQLQKKIEELLRKRKRSAAPFFQGPA